MKKDKDSIAERFRIIAENIKTKKIARRIERRKLNNQHLASRQGARNLEKSIAVLNAELELITATADDSTLSLLKQKEAAKEAGVVAVEVAKQEAALAGQRLCIIDAEIGIRQSFGEEVQDLLDAQTKAVETERALGQKQREIQRDIVEQRLDILIDGADKQKTGGKNITKAL